MLGDLLILTHVHKLFAAIALRTIAITLNGTSVPGAFQCIKYRFSLQSSRWILHSPLISEELQVRKSKHTKVKGWIQITILLH